MLAKYRIYTLLDFHQDIFSRFTCGEGLPDYLFKYVNTIKFPLPLLHKL